MKKVILGRTGLKTTIMGLGGGGPSRLGSRSGGDPEAVVRKALELGINFIDSSEVYGTEEAIGKAIKGYRRQDLILSTKFMYRRDGERLRAARLEEALDKSLARLGTDYADIYHIHAVLPHDYDYTVEEYYPALQELKKKGKLRFTGITEMFGQDTGHMMLSRAAESGIWDVIMTGFNILNQSARERVLDAARTHGIGTLCMFAVRRALRSWDAVRPFLQQLSEAGEIDPALAQADDLLPAFTDGHIETSLPDLAYRFARDEEDMDVILSGTGNAGHLEENYRSLTAPPLPEAVRVRLRRLFSRAVSSSAQ